ncbi:MAG TPA: hypothetical protein EYQ25_10930 [Planctomycetes bacterium]|nr:hypothetical protein [Planctomycetota bacterium]HIL38512.1 hypothetical protein [Planctomycetota bacterium]
MILADVIGTVVSPVQIKALDGFTLLMVRPVTPDGKATGKMRIALDKVGAGVGDRVLMIDEGNSGRQILKDASAPIKSLIVGFVDAVEVHGKLTYDHRQTQQP